MNTRAVVEKLKQNNEDFEFYPTTKEMIKCIYDYKNKNYSYRMDNRLGRVLDIGCGTCNFLKYMDELKKEDSRLSDDEKKGSIISYYYVIEKSMTLINMLDKDTIVLGTDFNQTTLIDKEVDTIFCNPPYSEYEEWTKRIISESVAKEIFLIIPQRWKENKDITTLLEYNVELNNTYKSHNTDEVLKYEVIGSFDFINAERSARSKVDILYIKRPYIKSDNVFNAWFNNTFKIEGKDNLSEYEVYNNKIEKISNALVCGKNKVETLVNLYNQEFNSLFSNFKIISTLDDEILESIGVTISKVRESLKVKIQGLKRIYWNAVFDELDDITGRLTTSSRTKLRDKFHNLLSIDFCESNIYSLLVWVCKNASDYFNEQLIDLFKTLSCYENVVKYKSNQKVFSNDNWRFRNEASHYTLDYRIVCDRLYFTSYSYSSSCQKMDKSKARDVIGDICAIANNLGFSVGVKEYAECFGEKYRIYLKDETELLEYKIFKNGNTHIKLNKEFAKAMNVEVSRLLGWIRSKEDIAKEFPEEMASGAEKYFKQNIFISLTNNNIKLLSA